MTHVLAAAAKNIKTAMAQYPNVILHKMGL